MFTAIALAALIAGQTAPQAAQDPDEAVAVEDILVEGRPLVERAREFVNEIAAPPNNRNLATWRTEMCVSAVNMPTTHGQAMVDRVSQVALHLGVRIGEPGCEPNVIIALSTDAQAMAAQLVDRRERTFRPNWTGSSQGEQELEAFVQSTAPVRWWHISIPVDAATGEVAVRMPGDGDGLRVVNKRMGATRLRSPLRDDMRKAFIIIDVDDVANVSFQQLADYVAFLAMAQTDPEADTGGYDTILNLFKGGGPDGLTAWDLAYLEALYASDTTQSNPNRHGSNVGRALARDIGGQMREEARQAQSEPTPEPAPTPTP